MEKSLSENILNVCQILNKHSVQYMIVGGTAVALHGYFRRSMNVSGELTDKPDLDFWFNSTYQNYFKLLNALEELGQNVTEFKKEKAPDPKKSFFRYDFEKFNLDLLPKLKSTLKFRDCFARKDVVSLNKIDIPFIGYNDLIFDKEFNGRPKDLIDIVQLKKRRGGKEKE
ncbi:MAG: hypothetical protein QM764_14615 [Chitinophagaceae bacterium]